MHECLKFLWNKAWQSGYFIKNWKQEKRIVIPKPGKDNYNECNSYRTISITSCIGKRSENITWKRLSTVLRYINFDPDQYAYLKQRSTTQAITTLIEIIKKSWLNNQVAAAVFVDFTDVFGSVNRSFLLQTIRNDFGITGHLYEHIASFLRDRTVQLKIGNIVGDLSESEYGTSAGTRLGPLLFIMHLHDIPKNIKPKFADDLVAVSTGTDIKSIQADLQDSTNKLLCWSDKEGMKINPSKTKVMIFGHTYDPIRITIEDMQDEVVQTYKYLGVVLDSNLDFSAHVDYAVSKAKRSTSKICTLIDGRKGISIQLGIQLYKTLVRPHLEVRICYSSLG